MSSSIQGKQLRHAAGHQLAGLVASKRPCESLAAGSALTHFPSVRNFQHCLGNVPSWIWTREIANNSWWEEKLPKQGCVLNASWTIFVHMLPGRQRSQVGITAKVRHKCMPGKASARAPPRGGGGGCSPVMVTQIVGSPAMVSCW